MHELAVTQSILSLALERAAAVGAKHVVNIYLEVGQLSSYVDESVQFYWDFISRGTLAKDAILHFQRVPLEMLCTECGKRFSPGGETFDCPQCDSHDVLVAQGEVFRMLGLDVEKESQTDSMEAK